MRYFEGPRMPKSSLLSLHPEEGDVEGLVSEAIVVWPLAWASGQP